MIDILDLDDLDIIVINSNNLTSNQNKNYIAAYSSAVSKRVEIFKKKGINQWQDNYAERNNPENVAKELSGNSSENLLVFVDPKTKTFVGALKLKDTERPGYWDNGEFENEGSKYITGLVSDPSIKGAGTCIMYALGEWALKNQVKKLRLDCKCNDEHDFLVNYYTKRGFKVVGKGYKAPTEKFSEYRYALCEGTPKTLIKANKKSKINKSEL